MSRSGPTDRFSFLPDTGHQRGSERYFFDVDDGEATHTDNIGIDLTSVDQIASEAYNILRQIVHDRWPEGQKTMKVRVRDRSGKVVYEGTMTINGRRSPP